MRLEFENVGGSTTARSQRAARAARVGEELAHVGVDDLAVELVEREVLARPLEVRLREIDARRLHAGGGAVDRERAGVAEEVQHRRRRLGGGASRA